MTEAQAAQIITLLTAILGHVESAASDITDLHALAMEADEAEQFAMMGVEGTA